MMTNAYLAGVDVLGAQHTEALSIADAKKLIEQAQEQIFESQVSDAGKEGAELFRQLENMEVTLNQKWCPDPLPADATAILKRTLASVHALATDLGPRQDEDVVGERWGTGEPEFGVDDDLDFGTDEIVGTDELVGAFDIGAAQLKMNALKPVTVGAAKALIHGGQQVMAVANQTAKQPFYKADLPGQTRRDEVTGHLKWHADALSKISDDKAIYSSGDDAKKWAMFAFIEANAVEEGAAYLSEAWSAMWTEIGENLAKVPQTILKAAASLPGKAFEVATGWPSWTLYVGSALLLGAVGYGTYQILKGPAGGAVVGRLLR